MGMTCICVIKFKIFFKNIYPWTHKRVENWRFLSESCPSTFQGIVNKWYARMSWSRPCKYPIRFQKLHFAPMGKKKILKITFPLLGTVLLSYFAIIPPWRKVWPFISTVATVQYDTSAIRQTGASFIFFIPIFFSIISI